MEFYKHLYAGESLEKKKEKVVRGLKFGKLRLHCYVILLTANPKNQLEFYDSLFLKQKNYKKDCLFVVGIAGSYTEALEVVQKITEDTYRKQGNADIRSYILEQQGS